MENKVKGIKYGTMAAYLRQTIDPDMLYFITDKGLLYRGSTIVVPTKVIGVERTADNNTGSYTFTIEAYADDPANPETITFDVWTKAAVTSLLNQLTLAIAQHGHLTASDTVEGHTLLSDATDGTEDAAHGGTAATPLAVKNALLAANEYTDAQIANISSGMNIIGTYGLQVDDPDEFRSLNDIPAAKGDTYICISTMTGVAYTNSAGIALSNASLAPGDYIICVQAAVTDAHDNITGLARWTIVANTASNAVTTNETLTADTLVLGNGHKTVKKLAAGTDGQFLRQTANEVRWSNHTNLDHGIAYGVCLAEEQIHEKTVTIERFILQEGSVVAVMFRHSVREGDTLQIVGTNVIAPIVYQNSRIVEGIIDKGDTATFIFTKGFDMNGETIDAWVLISVDRAPSNIPANLSAFNNDIQALMVCSTASGTNAKTVTNSSVTIKAGSVFAVRFSNAVGANSTLNINNTGAKPIKHRNAAIGNYQIRATDTATFIADGTAYHVLAIDRAFDTEPTAGSHRLVDSDAIYQALQSAISESTLYWEEMQ